MMSVIIVLLSLYEMKQRATHRESFFKGITKLSRSHWGMILAHLGVAMTVWGIAFSQNFSVERDVRMAVGDTVQIANYDFKFAGVSDANGPNYMGGKAQIDISKAGKPEATLFAEKRFYTVSKMPMTEAAINWGFTRDLYVALGEKIEDNWAKVPRSARADTRLSAVCHDREHARNEWIVLVCFAVLTGCDNRHCCCRQK